MAVRRLAPEEIQPKDFVFTQTMEDFARRQIAKYPEGRQASAVIPLLWHVQEQSGGWLPRRAIEAVADRLGMPYMRVLEVATFYTMFNLEPVGKYFIQCCGTTPCALRGANEVMDVLKKRIGGQHHVTADGLFSWLEVECLGSCCNAPMAQINADYYEDLTPEIMEKILDDLAAGKDVKPGSQQGRTSSEPKDAVFTLQDASLYDGSVIASWRQRFEAAAQPTAGTESEAAAATARAASEPKLGKPDAGRATERPVADAPAQRAAAGEPPVPPRAQAEAARTDTTATTDSKHPEAAPPPASDKSYVATPSAPEKGRPVADAPAGEEDEAAREEREIAAKLATLPKDATPEQRADHVGTRPAGLPGARSGGADDLKRIKGIGPVNEQKLNGLGIYHFDQVAAWSREEIRWVGAYLAFPGRIDRERWVAQAAELAGRQS